jgi:uncharacterized membrane protein
MATNKLFIFKIISIILLLFITLIFFYIKYENSNFEVSKEEVYTLNQSNDSQEKLKYKILYNGDSTAYMELYNIKVIDEMKPDEFLFWALVWANKYNKSEGYFDVYYCIVSSCYSDTLNISSTKDFSPTCYEEIDKKKYLNIDYVDERSFEFAINYLKIAAEKGNYNAIEELKKLKIVN